ncbi:MAG: hypothetical protein HC772_10270 [Leptolyngbyaceae cyanobacterium CRU_2_3]|nr:hypothetical protein [Leptolyngbyaceae cyanobacterium CRU_2_3]
MNVEPAATGEMQAVLAVGQANGVGKGTEFAIYPRSTTDFTKKENRVAIAPSSSGVQRILSVSWKPLLAKN